MTSLIKVKVDITCHKTKSNDLYITSTVYVPAVDHVTGRSQELIFKPKRNKDIKLDAMQLLSIVYGHNMECDKPLRLTNVQAYLLKGDEYNPYYLLRVRLYDGVALSIFLNNTELDLVTKYVDIKGEFKAKGDYEVVPFEAPRKETI